ncbi:MAG: hypothetical protein RMJ03_07130 [Nitrososphaerota archaeon]|nr:hypothetical protein [Nitrososphaerota archaeon]
MPCVIINIGEKMSISSIEYPSSALRYALLDVKPIPFEEIVKIKGIKFLKKGIRYEPEKKFDKIEDFVTFRYEQIFSRMPIPEAFSPEYIFDHFVSNTIKKIEEDKELREELEKKEKSLLGFVDFIQKRFENEISDYYMSEADRFLRSNLPLSFFAQTSMFINTYQKYLSLVKRIVRRYEILSSLGGVRDRLRSHEQQLASMKKVLGPLIDAMDLFCIDALSLKLYVTIWSAESIEEIENPKFLDINKLDPSYFQEYLTSYGVQLKNMRKLIFQMSREYDPEIFKKEVVSGNSETALLSKLLSSNL